MALKRPIVIEGKWIFRTMKVITLEAEDVMVKLRKRPKLVRHKIFKKANMLRFEEIKVESCGSTSYSWMQG